MKAGLPLMKNDITRLTKSVLIPLGLTAAVPVSDAAIQKNIHSSENNDSGTTAFIIANKETKGIMRIVKYLEKPQLK